jgi:hypothetical protein
MCAAMSPSRISLVCLCISAACGGSSRSTYATYPGAATAFDPAGSDPKAVELADKVFAAAGGPQGWDQAKQIRWKEAVTRDGAVAAQGEQAWDRWNGRHHGRLETPSGDVVVMQSLYEEGSGSAFIKNQKMGQAEAAPAIKAARERWNFDTAALLMPYLLKSPGTTLKYEGDAADDNKQPTLEQIKVTFDSRDKARDGSTYYVVVRKDTHIIERLEIVKAGQPDASRLGYKLGDWVTVNGMKFPTRHENIGYKGEVITFKDISVSAEPDEDLYVPNVGTGG